jgi:ABC-type transporter Mla MlaB component
LAPDLAVMSAGKGSEWTLPPTLESVALGKFKAELEVGPTPWRLDWSELTTVEEDVVPEMARLFSQWCSSRVRLSFMGAQQLDDLLRHATPAGNSDVQRDWWLWRLDALRMAQREDEFELVALDYCITYEMSPPAWERPLCDFSSTESDAAQAAHDGMDPLLIGDELLSTRSGAFSATHLETAPAALSGDADFDAAAAANRFALVELSGEIRGDAGPTLASLERDRAGANKLVVDCRHLIRVDFPAAGSLLNWTSARTTDGCKVEFKNVNRLVATFFSVIGIDEFARIVAPAN